VLARIAEALERLAPQAPALPDLSPSTPIVWHPGRTARASAAHRVEMSPAQGHSTACRPADGKQPSASPRPAGQTTRCVGRAAAWQILAGEAGARGGQRHACGGTLKLVEIHARTSSLPELMTLARDARYRFIVFCDDLVVQREDTPTNR